MSRKHLISLFGAGCLLVSAASAQNKSLQGGAPDAGLLPAGGGNASDNVFAPDLFNGTVNVSVPVYSYGNYGIALSYNTGGVKVGQSSGTIGLNWNLAAGGSIVRQMKDIPDEINVPANLVPVPTGGGAVSAPAANGLQGKFARYGLGVDFAQGNNTYQDDESDDFIFSVGGLSFTFSIGQDGFIFTHPQKSVKIELLYNGTPVTTASKIPAGDAANMLNIGFRVRDDQGNWYYFQEGDVSSVLYGARNAPDLQYDYISRWVIQKVVRNDGQQITYTYNVRSNTLNTNILYMSYSGYEQNNVAVAPSPAIATTGVEVQSNYTLSSYSNLDSIVYPNNVTAKFIYTTPSGGRCDEPGDVVMSEIRVGAGGEGIRYVFNQGYSLAKKDANSSYDAEIALSSPCQSIDATQQYNHNYWYHRLILKGVRIMSLDGSKNEPYYTFQYNNTVRLPSKLSGAQDYYGYYNGKLLTDAYGGRFNVPQHTTKYAATPNTYGVDKTPDINYAVAGLLLSVQNGKGGRTQFEYEAHSLSDVTASAGITLPTDAWFMGATATDGVRIKSVTTTDDHYPLGGTGTTDFSKQSFTYSGGQLFMPGGYFDFPTNTVNPNATYSPNLTPNTTFSGSFVSPHQSVNGSNHGYSTVTVTTTNTSGQQLGKRVLTFQNVVTGGHSAYYKTGSKNYFEYPFTDKQYIKEWELGLPLITTEYDAYNNLLSRTTNVYDFSGAVTQPSAAQLQNLKNLSTYENGLPSPYASETYAPYTGFSPLVKTTVEKYTDDNTAFTDVVTFTYDSHHNPDSTTTRNSKGEYFSLRNVYNYNVAGPNVLYGNVAGMLYDMTAAGLEVCVGMERWKKGSNAYSDNLMDASITRYQYNTTTGTLLSQKLFTLQTQDPVAYTTYTGLTQGGPGGNAFGRILTAYNSTATPASYGLVSEVVQADAKGNPKETQLKGQNSYMALLWDDANGNKLAEVQNARLADVAFTSFETDDQPVFAGSDVVSSGGFRYNRYGLQGSTNTASGGRVFNLVPVGAGAYNSVSTPSLTAGKTYVFSFWCIGVQPLFKDAAGTTVSATLEYSLSNGWKFYKAVFTPSQSGAAQLTAPVSATYLDELRLFPDGALMKNWTYAPYSGVTSATDPSGRITYYQYDVLGRQVAVKDQEGNIQSKTEYRIAQ